MIFVKQTPRRTDKRSDGAVLVVRTGPRTGGCARSCRPASRDLRRSDPCRSHRDPSASLRCPFRGRGLEGPVASLRFASCASVARCLQSSSQFDELAGLYHKNESLSSVEHSKQPYLSTKSTFTFLKNLKRIIHV